MGMFGALTIRNGCHDVERREKREERKQKEEREDPIMSKREISKRVPLRGRNDAFYFNIFNILVSST